VPEGSCFLANSPPPGFRGRWHAQRDGGGLLFPLPIAFVSQDPLRLTLFGTSPAGAGEEKMMFLCETEPRTKKTSLQMEACGFFEIWLA